MVRAVKVLLGIFGLSTFAQALPAQAADVAPVDAAPAAAAPPNEYGHAGQLSLRAALVGGYRMVLRYDDSPFGAAYDTEKSISDQQKFCGHAAPPALDLALGYAPANFVEPYLWFRLGLSGEEQTRTAAVKILGAGLRIYTMSDAAVKIYVEPAIGFELEGGEADGFWLLNEPEYQQDLVFHIAAGPQFDLSHNLGLFLDGGVTTGVLRAIHSSLELKAGLQLRLP
jgi:hypothetical protein